MIFFRARPPSAQKKTNSCGSWLSMRSLFHTLLLEAYTPCILYVYLTQRVISVRNNVCGATLSKKKYLFLLHI